MNLTSLRRNFALLAAALLCSAPALFAQAHTAGSSPAGSTTSNATGDVLGKDRSPFAIDTTIEMAAPHETDDYLAFTHIADSKVDKKVKAGEDFVRKYPKSPYVPDIYSSLTIVFIQAGQYDKGFADGDKAIALKPTDVRTRANVSQAMARVNNPSQPDSAAKLEKAEQYAKECLQITPLLPRPETVIAADFTAAVNQVLSMAHSALGTIALRRNHFEEAIPDLKEAIRLDTAKEKDGTNFYLLGVASQNSAHDAEALYAFTKCIPIAPANLQQACRDGAAEAKKHLPKN